MAHPFHHALSSVKRWGGTPDDYLPIHDFFDASKMFLADVRHRALRHHAEGIFLAERLFGTVITNSQGRLVPVRFIGEQHVQEDLGWIPTVKDWLQHLRVAAWMARGAKLDLSPAERATGTAMSTDSSSDTPQDTPPRQLRLSATS